MVPEELGRACLDEMRERDGPAAVGDVAKLHGVALLGMVGVAAVLIGYALGVQDSDRDDAVCGRIAMYWLLDDSAEVRLGAAEGFRERALSAHLASVRLK